MAKTPGRYPQGDFDPGGGIAISIKLQVSQTVFAGLLNVSPQAVRNWEQGVNRPAGATLRLLQIARQYPETLLRLIG